MTLAQAATGKVFKITGISDPETAMMAMRLGIHEGESFELASRVPGGPLIIRRGNVEIALGRELCQSIEVESP